MGNRSDPSEDESIPERESINPFRVVSYVLKDDGIYPNDPRLALLLYPGGLRVPEKNPASTIERLFKAHESDPVFGKEGPLRDHWLLSKNPS